MIASQSYDPLHYGVLSSDDHTIILTQGRAYVKTHLHYLQKRDIIIPYYFRKTLEIFTDFVIFVNGLHNRKISDTQTV